MARQEIDLTTPQPNGKMGEPTKSAWEKVNDMTAEIYAKLSSGDISKTIDDYGAVGDGVADDSQSFISMLSDVGYIKLGRKTYRVNSLELSGFSVSIIGQGRPSKNSSGTALVDGTGSIVVGSIVVRCQSSLMVGFGLDVSASRGFSTGSEGLIVDAPEGGSGIDATFYGIACMGHANSDGTHAILHEGFDSHSADEIYLYNHGYGFVDKSRNGVIGRIVGENIQTAAYYAKSSIPSVGGNVISAISANNHVQCVLAKSSHPQSSAVWIHGEGGPASMITVDQVSMTGGNAAVRVYGDTESTYVVGVKIGSIMAESCQTSVNMAGSTYDIDFGSINVSNPSLGWAVYIAGTLHRNWHISSINLSITSSSITQNDGALMQGTGSFDVFTCRNSARNMILSYDMASIVGGKMVGNVVYFGEGDLLGSAGNTVAAGAATCKVSEGNVIELFGEVDTSGNTGGTGAVTIATISGTADMGGYNMFMCAAVKTDNSYIPIPIYAGQKNVISFLPLTGIKLVYLNGIRSNRS